MSAEKTTGPATLAASSNPPMTNEAEQRRAELIRVLMAHVHHGHVSLEGALETAYQHGLQACAAHTEAKVRAEERELCAKIADEWGAYCTAKAIRGR